MSLLLILHIIISLTLLFILINESFRFLPIYSSPFPDQKCLIKLFSILFRWFVVIVFFQPCLLTIVFSKNMNRDLFYVEQDPISD